MSNATDLSAALALYKQQTGISLDASAVLSGALELYSQQVDGGFVLAAKDPAVVLAQALADYKTATISPSNPNGITLAPADPRRLHLQAFVLMAAQLRALIDFAGKQSLLRFVSDLWIDPLAELWEDLRIPAAPSQCTERFAFATVAPRTIPAGVRVADDAGNTFTVLADTSATDDHVDALVACTVTGGATNAIAEGQISTLVDPSLVPGCTGVSNTTETDAGRDVEQLEDFRARLRGSPENRSTCGPRNAYRANALKASASVADAAVIGPEDGGSLAGATPTAGQVVVMVIEGERDAKGVLTSVIPDPSGGVISTVNAALTAEDVRPLGDDVTVRAPSFVDFDSIGTYYIARSRADSAAAIQVAVQQAWDGYILWQQSVIGRDIGPYELITRVVNAGAKRIVLVAPTYALVYRDESARCVYSALVYGGVEDD